MAFGRLERSTGATPMSDINMTPLIDVMLVLLVIFMISAPLMTSSLKLDLPKADGARPNDAPQFISIALDPQGRLFFGDEPIVTVALAARVADAARKNPKTEVQLRADQAVPYGRVAEVIGVVQKAGLNRIGFVTEPGAVAAPPALAAPAPMPTPGATPIPAPIPAPMPAPMPSPAPPPTKP